MALVIRRFETAKAAQQFATLIETPDKYQSKGRGRGQRFRPAETALGPVFLFDDEEPCLAVDDVKHPEIAEALANTPGPGEVLP